MVTSFLRVVFIKEPLNVSSSIIYLIVYPRVGQGAVGAQGLERAQTHVQRKHDFLIVHPVLQAVIRTIVIRDNEVGIGFPKGLEARALGEGLLEEVFVASGCISDADADEF